MNKATYQQIIDLVQDCVRRMQDAGESHRMLARWISEGIDALSAGQAQPGAIKLLEWEEFKTDFKRSFQANTVVGQYQIGYLGEFEEWQLYSPGAPSWRECFTRHVSVSAAKIAARVAYESRILSALVPPAIPGEVETESLQSYFERQINWSRETFGPALRTKGVIEHIRKELREIEQEPHDLSEWIDVVILAMDGFWRHGGNASDLLPALLAKQVKNMARVWPDWRTRSEDQAIEHDRSHDAALSVPPEIDGGDKGDGWQPIETAPKDGTRILVIDARGHVQVGACGNTLRKKQEWRAEYQLGRVLYPQPSHWQHLPAAPSASIEGETP